jgi:hypothetical protein
LLAGLSRSKWAIGFETDGQNRHYLYDFSVKHSPKVHELSNFGSLLAPLGVKASSKPPMALSRIPDSSWLKIKQPYVVLHPWASGNHFELREWPQARWLELAQKLAQSGYGIVLTGGSAVMPGMVELGEDIFLKPVRRGIPNYNGGLADMVSQPRAATAMGLLEEARVARMRGFKVSQKSSTVKTAVDRVKDWFVGNF